MIQRKSNLPVVKRQTKDRLEKNERIGELLKLDKVPLHCLEWKEPRLNLPGGDCYPLVDVLLGLAELKEAKKPGRPKKVS